MGEHWNISFCLMIFSDLPSVFFHTLQSEIPYINVFFNGKITAKSSTTGSLLHRPTSLWSTDVGYRIPSSAVAVTLAVSFRVISMRCFF